jgi:hypothetical protein
MYFKKNSFWGPRILAVMDKLGQGRPMAGYFIFRQVIARTPGAPKNRTAAMSAISIAMKKLVGDGVVECLERSEGKFPASRRNYQVTGRALEELKAFEEHFGKVKLCDILESSTSMFSSRS